MRRDATILENCSGEYGTALGLGVSVWTGASRRTAVQSPLCAKGVGRYWGGYDGVFKRLNAVLESRVRVKSYWRRSLESTTLIRKSYGKLQVRVEADGFQGWGRICPPANHMVKIGNTR